MPKSQATEDRLRLCCAELERRLRKGEPSRAEDFFAAYPDLAAAPEIALDLIYSEYLARCELGGSPSPDEYYCRFPQWREALFHQFEIHTLLGGPQGGAEPAPWPLGSGPSQPWKHSPENFEIFEEIARGSMGIVYKAWQKDLKRVVALKVILARTLSTPDQLARFRVEATAIGRLFHPNIVQIFRTQEWEGCPFLVLEHVEGKTLAKHWDGRPQPANAVAKLVETLAAAMQYAHERAVVHRDLRPGNILMTEQGVPKIIDFGLAKISLLNDEDLTLTGQILGTPSYMSPEQADGVGRDHGPQVDIYALGAVLYEGLTGRPPFRGETILETLHDVNNKEPLPPRRLEPTVPRDLETICLKCLQKEPHQRYPSARELADDLRRFLVHEPIRARPVGSVERLGRWCRRNTLVASLMAALTVMFALGLGLVVWKWREEVAARAAADQALEFAVAETARAHDERSKNERMAAGILVDQGVHLGEHGHVDHALHLFAKSLESAERNGDAALERAARVNLTAFRQQLLRRRAQLDHDDWVWAAAFSRDGKFFVTASKDKSARLWDTETGRLIGQPMRHDHPVWGIAVSPDGKTILTGSGEPAGDAGEARLWDVAGGQPLGPPLVHGKTVGTVAFHPDGKIFLTLDAAGKVQIWDTNRRTPVGDPLPHPGLVRSACFSPDGKLAATAGNDGTVRLWHVADRAPFGPVLSHQVLSHEGAPEKMPKHHSLVVTAAFSSDSKLLATGSQIVDAETKKYVGGDVRLWQVATGQLAAPALIHAGPVKTAAFSPDDARLLTGGFVVDGKNQDVLRGEARLWDVASGRQMGPTLHHAGPIWAAAFSPNGRILATGAEKGYTKFWLAASGAMIGMSSGSGNARCIAMSPDGKHAVVGHTYTPAVADLWELPAGGGADVLPPLHDKNIHALGFSPDGKLVVTASEDGTARLWDVAGARPFGRPFPHRSHAAPLFSRRGELLLTMKDNHVPQIWSTATCQTHGPSWPPRTEIVGAAIVDDRERVLIRDELQRASWWDMTTGKPEERSFDIGNERTIVRADGTLLATIQGARVQLRRLPGGKAIGPPLQQRANVTAFAFSPDGALCATGADDGTAYLWDCARCRAAGKPLEHPGPVRGLTFSSDGRAFLAWSGSNHVRLWNSSTGKPLLPPLLHPAEIAAAVFTADGQTVAVASGNVLYLWDIATGKRLGPALRHPDLVTHLAASPDGKRLATACADRSVRFWDVVLPASASAADNTAWVEALTGRELTDTGTLHEIDADTLQNLRHSLETLGVEPFPRPAPR